MLTQRAAVTEKRYCHYYFDRKKYGFRTDIEYGGGKSL